MPLRRYQIPSRVRQTSSASILPPSVRRMTGLRFAGVSVLVEIGFRLEVVCAVAARSGEAFGDGEGEGDGDGEGIRIGVGDAVSGSAATKGISGAGLCEVL